jgi:hypothetical protein
MICELIGIRGPTVDLTLVIAMALTAILLLAFYAIRDAAPDRDMKEGNAPLPIRADNMNSSGTTTTGEEEARDIETGISFSAQEPDNKNALKKKRSGAGLSSSGLLSLRGLSSPNCSSFSRRDTGTELTVSLGAERVHLMGLNLSVTIVSTWVSLPLL